MELGTGYWLIAGCVMLVGGLLMLAYSGFKAVTAKRYSDRMESLLLVLMALYPIGVGFKSAVIGPEFVRFHLSDIGFPVFIGYTLYHHFRSGFTKNNPDIGKDALADTAQALRHRKGTLAVALVLSYLYEVSTGWLYSLRPDLEPWLVGTFDWWDIVNYTLGATLAYTVMQLWSRKVAESRANVAELEAELRRLQGRGPRPGQRPQTDKRRRRKDKGR